MEEYTICESVRSVPFINGYVHVCEANGCPRGYMQSICLDGEPKTLCMKDGKISKEKRSLEKEIKDIPRISFSLSSRQTLNHF
jgi:hypothetical protein